MAFFWERQDLTRGEFIKAFFLKLLLPYFWLILLFFFLLSLFISAHKDISSQMIWLLSAWWFMILFLLWLVVLSFFSIKRLRNIWLSWFWVLLYLLPIINLFLLLFLMIKKWLWISIHVVTPNINQEGISVKNRPLWISVILFFMFFWVLSQMMLLVRWSFPLLLWPWIFQWVSSFIYMFMMMWVTISLIYGILNKRKWAWKGILWLYVFTICISLLNFMYTFFDTQTIFKLLELSWNIMQPGISKDFIIMTYQYSFGSTILMACIFIYIIVKNKKYFSE